MKHLTHTILIITAIVLVSCQEPNDGVTILIPNPNPLIDSTAQVIAYGLRDALTFTTYVSGNIKDGDHEVTVDSFAIHAIGAEVFDAVPGDSLTAQAARAGISSDSALVLGKKALAVADTILGNRSLRITRDPRYPNMNAKGEFLRRVTYHVVVDSVHGFKDYTDLLKERGLTVP